MNQNTNVPVPKVKAVGWAGGIVTLVLLITSMVGIEIPAEQVNQVLVGVSALVSIVTFLAGYFKKSNVKES